MMDDLEHGVLEHGVLEHGVLAVNYQIGAILDEMSLEELDKTIQTLHQEISRIENEIEKKQRNLMQAEGVFKF